jgi:hypothetical protein
MTDTAAPAEAAEPRPTPAPQPLFAVAAFVSASLVFMVEPMVAKLVLPLLGGSAAVWNTSLAFFQIALLAGYAYAHALQRLASVRAQIALHLTLLLAAGLTLPLRVTGLFGEPPPGEPALWLVGVLAVSIGAPFAALSATAPLVQAWHARVVRHEDAKTPYTLYAASNVGSLLALLAYPVLVEPNVTLGVQTGGWTLGYGAFVLIAAGLGAAVWRADGEARALAPRRWAPRASWRQRLTWLALAAIPSSLMLGVTSYITTDLGSAPFLWVAPLALYLATFIIAFQERPLIPPGVALVVQALAAALCGVFMRFWAGGFVQELAIHLTAFFFAALVCHQALAARRPPPEQLTEFYIWMSLGGVLGGAFNAFVAPVIFSSVIEYPAALVLACLARPWGRGPMAPWRWGLVGLGGVAAAFAVVVHRPAGLLAALAHSMTEVIPEPLLVAGLLTITADCAVLLRGRALVFAAMILALVTASAQVSDEANALHVWRSFFGVLRISRSIDPQLGPVRFLSHGTTLHGAQAEAGPVHCRPLTYYAPDTPIGQVFAAEQAKAPALAIGAVGLGAGTVAAYTRPGDALRFFEIDPLVLRISSDPRNFTYLTACAHGRIAYTLGDARLTLARTPPGSFDLLLIDAFTSDSIPAHLLTVQAVRMYLTKLKPDGVIILHLSNRNLDLMRPAEAVAIAAGGQALAQDYTAPASPSFFASSDEDAVIITKTAGGLAPFVKDRRWTMPAPQGVRPWTDDYTNLFGALARRTADKWGLGS